MNTSRRLSRLSLAPRRPLPAPAAAADRGQAPCATRVVFLPFRIDHMSIPQCQPDGSAKKNVLRIFLVEEVPAVRELIVASFAEIDGICWTGFAESENEALEKLSLDACDVLIVDIELKQGNGMSLLRRLMQTNLQPEA